MSPPRLHLLLVEGTLVFARRDLHLRATYIMVRGGTLQIGTEAEPFQQKATITMCEPPRRATMHCATAHCATTHCATLLPPRCATRQPMQAAGAATVSVCCVPHATLASGRSVHRRLCPPAARTWRRYGNIATRPLPTFGAKVLAVFRGTLDLHGRRHATTWTRLARPAEANSSTICLQVRSSAAL